MRCSYLTSEKEKYREQQQQQQGNQSCGGQIIGSAIQMNIFMILGNEGIRWKRWLIRWRYYCKEIGEQKDYKVTTHE